MAVPTDALTTRTKVKSFLGITDSSSDTVIDELITGVTAFIKSYCGGRSFLSASYVETYDTYKGRHKIFLKQLPVSAISAVEYRSGTPSSPQWVTYSADGYLPYFSTGYIYFYGALPQIAQGMRISYTAGYLIDWNNEFSATHTLPADLTLAANEMVASLFNTRRASGITNETTEGQSITYDFNKAVTPQVSEILTSYKITRIARS